MAVQYLTVARPVVPAANVLKVALQDNSPVAVVLCIPPAASPAVGLREERAPVSVSSVPASAARVLALANAPEWARRVLFRLRAKHRARSVPAVSSAVAVSSTRRPKKAQ